MFHDCKDLFKSSSYELSNAILQNSLFHSQRGGKSILCLVGLNVSRIEFLILHQFKDPKDKQIRHFYQDEDDDDPLEFTALSVFHDVLKKLKILFDDGSALIDISLAVFEVKGLFQRDMQSIHGFVLPGDVWGIKNIEVFGNLVFDVQDLANKSF